MTKTKHSVNLDTVNWWLEQCRTHLFKFSAHYVDGLGWSSWEINSDTGIFVLEVNWRCPRGVISRREWRKQGWAEGEIDSVVTKVTWEALVGMTFQRCTKLGEEVPWPKACWRRDSSVSFCKPTGHECLSHERELGSCPSISAMLNKCTFFPQRQEKPRY